LCVSAAEHMCDRAVVRPSRLMGGSATSPTIGGGCGGSPPDNLPAARLSRPARRASRGVSPRQPPRLPATAAEEQRQQLRHLVIFASLPLRPSRLPASPQLAFFLGRSHVLLRAGQAYACAASLSLTLTHSLSLSLSLPRRPYHAGPAHHRPSCEGRVQVVVPGAAGGREEARGPAAQGGGLEGRDED
jgi:hypothetical protein